MRAGLVALLALGVACSGGGGGGERAERASRACALLEHGEVESFVGEPVREARPDETGESVADTCRWGDADPAAPGHVLSITLAPAGAVDEVAPGEGDNVYDLPALGAGAQGVQQAGGGVRVLFRVAGERVDMVYDVVPVDALEADAIDRLARLAERVRDRLGALR